MLAEAIALLVPQPGFNRHNNMCSYLLRFLTFQLGLLVTPFIRPCYFSPDFPTALHVHMECLMMRLSMVLEASSS